MRQGLAGNRAERWTRRRAKPRNFYALFTYTEHPYTYLSGGAEMDIAEKRVWGIDMYTEPGWLSMRLGGGTVLRFVIRA
jgi:hypothetical protein